MRRKEKFIFLDIPDEKLDPLVRSIRDALMAEFWPHITVGSQRAGISARLEESIVAAIRAQT
jgi:hypothetical protein